MAGIWGFVRLLDHVKLFPQRHGASMRPSLTLLVHSFQISRGWLVGVVLMGGRQAGDPTRVHVRFAASAVSVAEPGPLGFV